MLCPHNLDHLGDALRRLRTAASCTQAEVCDRTRLRTPQLSRWENGHEVPTLESLVKFLSAVGASFADLEQMLLGNEGVAVAPAAELRRIRLACCSVLARKGATPASPPGGKPPGYQRRLVNQACWLKSVSCSDGLSRQARCGRLA